MQGADGTGAALAMPGGSGKGYAFPSGVWYAFCMVLPGVLGEIAEIVGEPGAVALSRRYGGSYLYVPMSTTLDRPMRDEAIRDAYDRGEPVREIARRYQLTERAVRMILKKLG